MRVICWIIGHDWKVTMLSRSKHLALVHLHPLAGCQAKCQRCNKMWDDLPNDGRTDVIAGWSEAEASR